MDLYGQTIQLPEGEFLIRHHDRDRRVLARCAWRAPAPERVREVVVDCRTGSVLCRLIAAYDAPGSVDDSAEGIHHREHGDFRRADLAERTTLTGMLPVFDSAKEASLHGEAT